MIHQIQQQNISISHVKKAAKENATASQVAVNKWAPKLASAPMLFIAPVINP